MTKERPSAVTRRTERAEAALRSSSTDMRFRAKLSVFIVPSFDITSGPLENPPLRVIRTIAILIEQEALFGLDTQGQRSELGCLAAQGDVGLSMGMLGTNSGQVAQWEPRANRRNQLSKCT